MARRIERLEQAVVDKIAAGEVVHRPANALKELLENSLDAGARQISVVAGAGGLKLLQITDDGCGIAREDLDIVCERFTTSKLRSFEDLREISSYGFRGEALSSVSHVAHVTITSKTNDQPCAYRAHYRDGVLVPKVPGGPTAPVPCAGKTGTQILVEDMFYNLTTRKQALKNVSEQYQRILDVVQRYALHYASQGKGFVCKKHREVTCDVNISQGTSQVDVIKAIFGPSIASEVIPVAFTEATPVGNDKPVTAIGYITNANYNTKKATFILFINNRLVECPTLRRAIEHVYAQYLPKHSHPFVYLAMTIPPMNVDVNVHPTKREVHFLHEETLVQAIADYADALLRGGNESRVFAVQPIASMLTSHLVTRRVVAPSSALFSQDSAADDEDNDDDASSDDQATPQRKAKKRPLDETSPLVHVSLTKAKAKTYVAAKAPQRLVRTDHQATTMDQFLVSDTSFHADDEDDANVTLDLDSTLDESEILPPTPRRASSTADGELEHDDDDEDVDPQSLTSIMNLKDQIRARCDRSLTKLFREHTFVGLVDDHYSVIQHLEKLYIVRHGAVAMALMYQHIVRQFGSFSTITLHEPLPIFDLVLCALENPQNLYTEADGPKDAIARTIQTTLLDKAPMLAEYLGVHFTPEGLLARIPVVLPGHEPSMHALPEFILQLQDVPWDEEEACFEGVCTTLALWYSDMAYPEASNEKAAHVLKHVIYPALKTTQFEPPHQLHDNGILRPIASLNNLYKIFERC